jgi:hypothetical protein
VPDDLLINPPEGLSGCETLAFWKAVGHYAKTQTKALWDLAILEHQAMGAEPVETPYGRLITANYTQYQYSAKVERLMAMVEEQRKLERDEGTAVSTTSTTFRLIESTEVEG